MQTREIGTSGIHASVVGLGCNNFGLFQDAAQATACVHRALDVGITCFDMASEHGQGLEETLVAAALGARRKDVVIATKVGQVELLGLGADGEPRMGADTVRSGLSRRWIMQSVEESLRRLKTDYIDLYQPHVSDPAAPREETLRALDDLVRQGKVRAIGEAATFATAGDLEASLDIQAKHGLASFVSAQTQYSLLTRDAESRIIPELRRRKMSLLPYFPLANGLLSGKYRPGAPYPAGSRLQKVPFAQRMHNGPEIWRRLQVVQDFADACGLSMIEVAIGWLLAEPAVASVIAGATSSTQIEQNAAAADKVLSPADRLELDRLLETSGDLEAAAPSTSR